MIEWIMVISMCKATYAEESGGNGTDNILIGNAVFVFCCPSASIGCLTRTAETELKWGGEEGEKRRQCNE